MSLTAWLCAFIAKSIMAVTAKRPLVVNRMVYVLHFFIGFVDAIV
ncbi:Identified by MetaGeneAnnotator (fragment) [Kingella kingae]